MSTLSYNWIVPLSVLIITGFGFAILSYVFFYRNMQTKINLVFSSFTIPLIVTVYSFIFQNNLPFSHLIVLSEIAMMIMAIGISAVLKYKIRLVTALFVNSIVGIALCVVLAYAYFIPFLFLDFRIYLIISVVLTFAFVIVIRKTDEANSYIGFSLLGISQLIALFQSIPAIEIAALALKLYFYFYVTRFLFSHTYQEIMKEVVEARRIKNEFNDILRKEVKKHTFSMEMSRQKMEEIAQTDTLTNTYNRKGIMYFIEYLIDDPKIKVFSILMFDIDKFKSINDTMGHLVGDKCLKTLSIIAKKNLRAGEYLGRYGGDEFILLLPHTDTMNALNVAERLRQCIHKETNNPHFTVSIGVATYPADGKNIEELIEHADAGLYISKKEGRNLVSKQHGG